MLLAIRSNVGSWIVKILMGLLILAFAAWGLEDLFSEPEIGETVVAEVGSREIQLSEVDNRLRLRIANLQQVFGPEFDQRQAIDMGFGHESLDNLIVEAIHGETAAALGLSLPTEFVADQVRNQPIFMNSVTNQFDRRQFLNILRSNGYTEAGYIDVLQGELVRQTVVDTVSFVPYAPSVLTDAMVAFRRERRDADIVRINEADLTVTPIPNATDLRAYYTDNPDEFIAPEYRRLTVITLRAADLVEGIAVSDEQLQRAYDSNYDRYVTPELRAFNQVLVSDRETADALVAAARDAGGLEAGLEAAGIESGIIPLELGPESGFVVPAVASAGFAAEPGGIADPAESSFGFHVLEVTEIVEGGVRSLEEVSEELRLMIAQDEALDVVFQLGGELDDSIASGNSLEEAADQLDLNLHVVDQVSSSGFTPEGTALDLPLAAEIVREAFSLGDGEESLLVESSFDSYFIVRVDGITEPAVPPFEEIELTVRAAWTLAERRASAADLAASIAEDVRQGEDLTEAAEKYGFAVESVAGVLRDGTERGSLPATAVGVLFRLGDDGVAAHAVGDDQVVVRLTGIHAPTTEEAEAAEILVSQEVIEGTGLDLQTQVTDALRAANNVTVWRDRLDRLVQN